jgi:hypothetical protein
MGLLPNIFKGDKPAEERAAEKAKKAAEKAAKEAKKAADKEERERVKSVEEQRRQARIQAEYHHNTSTG